MAAEALFAAALRWWDWIAPVALQAAVFAVLVLIVDRLLARRGWPILRHTLWLLAALRFVLPPTLASPVAVGALLHADLWPRATSVVDGAASPAAAIDVAAAAQALPAWPLALLALWLAGALAAATAARRARRRVSAALQGEPAPPWLERLAAGAAQRLGLHRTPRVVVVAGLASACVRGLLRPMVALPATTPRADVESMLLHELAHVKRRDLWIEAALSLLCVAFWFHPGAWLVKRRVEHVREICCDEAVAAALGSRAGEYRATLLRAAARLAGEPSPGPAFLGLPCQIVARLRWLEQGPARHPRLRAAATGAVALLLAACVLPMAPLSRPGAGPPAAFGTNARVDAARQIISSAMDGSARPGCLRLHLAAMALEADARDRH